MKKINMFIIIGLFFVGLSGCSLTGFLSSDLPTDSVEKPLSSAQDHLSHAQRLEQDLSRLEEQVARIDQTVNQYQKKPYLDPKGFRQDGLKILRGSNLKEIETLQEKVAWHRAQASRLAGLDTSNQEQDLGREDILSEQVSLTGRHAINGKQVDQRPSQVTTTSSS